MRRISALSLRAPQVTYFYVRSYRGARDALNCSHLRRFISLRLRLLGRQVLDATARCILLRFTSLRLG